MRRSLLVSLCFLLAGQAFPGPAWASVIALPAKAGTSTPSLPAGLIQPGAPGGFSPHDPLRGLNWLAKPGLPGPGGVLPSVSGTLPIQMVDTPAPLPATVLSVGAPASPAPAAAALHAAPPEQTGDAVASAASWDSLESVRSRVLASPLEDLKGSPMEEGRAIAAKAFEPSPRVPVLGLEGSGRPRPGIWLPSRQPLTRSPAYARMARMSLSSTPVPEDKAGKRVIQGLSLARVISNSAYMLQAIAFPMMAMALVGAPAFAGIGAAVSAAGILLAFANGSLADKLSPRSIMVGGSVLAAGASAALAAAASTGALNIWTLGGLAVALNGSLQAVVVGESSTAVQAVRGDPKRIQAVVSRFDLIFSAAGVAASLAGGFAVAAIGPAWAFAIFAAAQVAAAFVYFRTVPAAAPAQADAMVSANPASGPGLGETLSILRRSPFLMTLLALVLAAAALILPLQATLLPMIVQGPLKGSAALLGMVNAAIYAGILAGSVFNSLWSERFSNAALLKVSSLAFAAVGILLAAPFSVPVLLAAVAAVFLLQTVGFNVLRSLYMGRAQQDHPKNLGRLISLFSAGFGAAMALGTWLAGHAMAWLGYPSMLYLLAVPFGLATLLYAFSPRLLNKADLGRKTP